MINAEALELLNAGERVKIKNDKTRQYYQAYSNDHIFQFEPTPQYSIRVVAVFTPEQFLQTENIDFVAVDDEKLG